MFRTASMVLGTCRAPFGVWARPGGPVPGRGGGSASGRVEFGPVLKIEVE